jgi:hypothetical protein
MGWDAEEQYVLRLERNQKRLMAEIEQYRTAFSGIQLIIDGVRKEHYDHALDAVYDIADIVEKKEKN